MTNGSLMKVESIAESSPWSILQYFWPALSDNWSWKPIFGIFESGHFTQVLLYFFILFKFFYKYHLWMSSSLDPDQACHFVGSDQGPNFL